MRDDRARLEDILQAIAATARYAVRGRPALDRDELVQSWMVYHLTIIGEAAARLSPEVRHRHPEIPRPRVIGMRNILIHGYFAIDLEEVWATVEERVPVLRSQVEMILRGDTPAGPQTVTERRAAYRLVFS